MKKLDNIYNVNKLIKELEKNGWKEVTLDEDCLVLHSSEIYKHIRELNFLGDDITMARINWNNDYINFKIPKKILNIIELNKKTKEKNG